MVCVLQVGFLVSDAVAEEKSLATGSSGAGCSLQQGSATRTIGANLIDNGGFDNGIWYDSFRGWAASDWYQWFTRGDDAPEHAIGKRLPHSGKEYVRIHMWAHAWRGGVLQNVRDVEPCHMYRLSAYGFFQPKDAPEPNIRIGIDPVGTLAEQFSADVSKHPAEKYDRGVGDDPKSPKDDGPDVDDTTVWSETKSYYRWNKLEVTAEARSDVITAILCCDPKQRPPDKAIYEMNWDTITLYEVPWPTKRLVNEKAVAAIDKRLKNVIVTVQPEHKTAQVTWRTKIPSGVSQVLYRFLDTDAVAGRSKDEKEPTKVQTADFVFETPVIYERSATSHRVEIANLTVPQSAVELEVVALSRALIDGECKTLCSPCGRVKLK